MDHLGEGAQLYDYQSVGYTKYSVQQYIGSWIFWRTLHILLRA